MLCEKVHTKNVYVSDFYCDEARKNVKNTRKLYAKLPQKITKDYVKLAFMCEGVIRMIEGL